MNPELTASLRELDDLRAQTAALIADLPAEALNWQPLPAVAEHAMNSLAVLAAHLAGAEHFWITEAIGGESPTRDRDAEFQTRVTGPESLLARLEEVGRETHAVFARLTDADAERTILVQGRAATVRWGIQHVIAHSALHLGHMQITYQLWRNGYSQPSPRWFERLPDPG